MDTYSIILQATYTEIEYALFNGSKEIERNAVVKQQASSLLMDALNKMIQSHNLQWKDIAKIGVNQGPAPFTTLRALIATANGISFATGIPLVGIDGLKACAQEHHKDGITVVLLNAFAQDVYFAINDGTTITTGWQNGNAFLTRLQQEHHGASFSFVGNAVPLFEKDINTLFGFFPATHFECASLDSVAKEVFKEQSTTQHLTPLYLKTQHYKPA